MSTYKETLEVSKNSTCFLSFSYRVTQVALNIEGLARVEGSNCASLDKVSNLIENTCDTADKCQAAIETLLNTGKIKIEEEY